MILTIIDFSQQRLDFFEHGAGANRTATILACVLLSSFILPIIFKKFGFYLSLILSSITFYYFVQCQSRGGLIALCLSLIFLFCVGKFNYNKSKIIALCLSIFVCLFFYSESKISSRMSEMASLKSSSANCRAEIYLSGLKMISDAPNGLKDYSPSTAYSVFYQDINDSNSYISLINSHLEFLTKSTFLWRLLYLSFWAFTFSICFPSKRDTLSALCFSIWVAFGICGCFNNVFNLLSIWLIPLAFLLIACFYNYKRFLNRNFYSFVFIIPILTLTLIYSISYLLPRDYPIHFYSNGDILIGKEKPTSLLLFPQAQIIGNKFAVELISFCKENKQTKDILISDRPKKEYFKTIVVSDINAVKSLDELNTNKIVLLNPTTPQTQFKVDKALYIYLGSFYNWKDKQYWQNQSKENPQIKITILNGVAKYIPNWFKFFNYETN